MKNIKNRIVVHRKDPGPPSCFVVNNRGHIINLHNIVTVNNISIVDKNQPLLHVIHTEANHHSIVETFIVVYLLLSRKFVPIILNSNTQKPSFPIRVLSSVSSRTGISKGYKPCANIQSHVKDKKTIPKNEAITTKFLI